ncbi:MAG: prolyl-tRNA synthetase associated domain-containing protein [Oscillospiraceae bacterium]|jgi:Ala-tRNA(Pro) deacylase
MPGNEEKFTFDPVLHKGRPSDQRIPKEMKCYDLLDSLGIEYWRVDHSPAMNMSDCSAIEPLIGVGITKNLFLRNRQGTAWYMLMMPGGKPFHTKDLSGQLGISRLSFGEAEMMEKLLDLTPGSVSIMGLMNDTAGKVRLLMDRDVVDHEFIRCHPCINTSTIRMRTSDVLEKLLPRIRHIPTIVVLPDGGSEKGQ